MPKKPKAKLLRIYLQGAYHKFPDFFVWALLLIEHTWNSSPLWSNLPRLQCICTVPTTSGRPHESPLVWVCQWPSSQPLSSPQLSLNDSLWVKGISKSHREQGLDYREAEELCWYPSWSNSLWQGWSCGLVEMPLNQFEEFWPLRRNLFLNVISDILLWISAYGMLVLANQQRLTSALCWHKMQPRRPTRSVGW